MLNCQRLLHRFHCLMHGSAALLLGLALSACGSDGSAVSAPVDATPVGSNVSLVPTSEAALTSYFRTALGSAANSSLAGVLPDGFGVISATAVGATSTAVSTGPAVSATNLQEAGVDEADLIKSDGSVVYSLTGAKGYAAVFDTLRRDRLDPAGPALLTGDTLTGLFSADAQAKSMYLDADRKQLALLGEGGNMRDLYTAWFTPQVWAQGLTEVALVDTSNPAKMQKRRHLRINASLIGSRRIDATLYLVLRSFPNVPGLDPAWPVAKTAANQAILDTVKSTTLLPTLSLDGAPSQALVDASQCFTQPDNAVKSADVVTVLAIDLSSATHRHAGRCFTGGTEGFYMSEQSLYLATTRTAYTVNGAIPVYASQSSTDIHKFALNGLDIVYRGSGNVAGHLGFDQNRKSFRMGEYQGALRVITQTASTWGGWITPAVMTVGVASSATTPTQSQSPGHLSVLKESNAGLSVVGELPNAKRPQPLGKVGEQLYASRFLGPRGYLVTYRLTDPLYVLDLSDPADPKISGELQVDGYSDYLFPLTETLLLGVGKDAVSDGSSGDGRFAWYQGVKVSLIDVSDPTRPTEAARTVIGRRGTDASVLHDHHGIALQSVGNRVRIGLPVRLNDTPYPGAATRASSYYQFTRTELHKLELDLAQRSLKVRPAMASAILEERDISADRALIWNDQTHYFQSGLWSSAAW